VSPSWRHDENKNKTGGNQMIHHIEDKNITEEVIKNSNKLVIVDFYAEWCMPCQMLAPILKELDDKYENVEIFKVNIDESEEYAMLNNITSVPTLIFYHEGKETERIVGLESLEKLSNIVEYYGLKD
jgi:thioredoxin 1